MVVFTQVYRKEYSIRSAVNVALGITTATVERLRKYAEFWTLEQIACANGGNGIAVGDEASGIAISILRSDKPFYVGQAACEETGLYHTPTLEHSEDSQPQDRFVTQDVTL